MGVDATTKITDVAVAVITQADGSFLLARRPEGKPYAGYWEFPGGKVEPNEGVRAALAREIKEELGLEITHAYPWVTQVFAAEGRREARSAGGQGGRGGRPPGSPFG